MSINSRFQLFIFFIYSLTLDLRPLLANIPTAYLACEGANVGDRCSLPGPEYGTCTRDTLCVDPPDTKINECVLCVDDCWALIEGDSCTRRFTGTPGICQTQMQCTDKEATSFKECQRCVAEDSMPQTDDSSNAQDGCRSFQISGWIGILLIVFIGYHQFRNKEQNGR